VLLPGSIFSNEFEELLKRLRDINRIIRAFSELATGGAEPIIVKQISTTDPQFFFGISVLTLAAVSKSVAWALETWKKVEEIRNLREQTQKLSTPLPDIEGAFEKKIEETIKAAIATKTDEMLADIDGSAARAKEQKAHVSWALESLLAYIETGLTMEVRFKLPAESTPASEQSEDVARAFETLSNVAPKLSFPKADERPVFSLPKSERLDG
jgi:hypothetical protein